MDRKEIVEVTFLPDELLEAVRFYHSGSVFNDASWMVEQEFDDGYHRKNKSPVFKGLRGTTRVLSPAEVSTCVRLYFSLSPETTIRWNIEDGEFTGATSRLEKSAADVENKRAVW